MGSEADPDRVRLTVPADPAMVDVVRAAVRSLCARVGLVEATVEATRTSVGDAFLELVDLDGEEVVVLDGHTRGASLEVVLTAGPHSRRMTARRGPSTR